MEDPQSVFFFTSDSATEIMKYTYSLTTEQIWALFLIFIITQIRYPSPYTLLTMYTKKQNKKVLYMENNLGSKPHFLTGLKALNCTRGNLVFKTR